ncbi:hypothetical protein Q4E93_11675 [Flavitalea sp. BT771]|uniref:hypothetical protein n=1 Tax=Flavitalea sp. BT771 TaxID=3063329 RepID=UPI0026E29FEF|nr:hypothetical protein [Flavitalea sp. BT771]MDO6431251.1 hypothetical protein [Flavitalea sp. BT771]MDV6220159.1 hypothetical protein [Flavitalea sp. BT771]
MTLLSWLLLLYGRILQYQSCRITPLSTSPALACDCQKQVPEASTTNKQHSTENSVFKPRPEEIFMALASPSPDDAIGLLLPGSADKSYLVVAGHTGAIFQPPRGNVFFPLFI